MSSHVASVDDIEGSFPDRQFNSAKMNNSDDINLPRGSYSTCENPAEFGPDIRVEVVVRSEVDPVRGMSMDNTELQKCMKKAFLEPQEKTVHGDTSQPYCDVVVSTLENVAIFIWQRMEPLMPKGTLYEVTVCDAKNVVCYRG
ncbi:6-pyruvoyl tetrahydrobiopterin synthase-like [Saccoglossus kowalevskii]|uniref:6-pyruvoyltetrahydropterin synthase n=1 Tax=Saccoglossus kowalevskii TaxID=10224 RepID=A0ABM0GME2_SACKO|nr:PREDICTED: 6-pyruvoyl tetrahydrobiopterin synthase-like [Saccoglossus kowalevskii]